MSFTLIEASKMSNDVLTRGIVDLILSEPPLMSFRSVRDEILKPKPQVSFADSYNTFDGNYKKFKAK